MAPLRKAHAAGKGQSKNYVFINLRAHYLKVSVIPRRQTMQHPGVEATSAKRQKSHPRAAAIARKLSWM